MVNSFVPCPLAEPFAGVFFLSNFLLFTFYFYCDFFFNLPGILRKHNHLFISVPPVSSSLLEMLIQGFVYLENIPEIRSRSECSSVVEPTFCIFLSGLLLH